MKANNIENKKLYLKSGIKQARKKFGYTQQQFVDVLKWQFEIKLSLSMWQKMERGVEPITISNAAAVARVLGLSVINITERR